jgi:peptidoglycan/xylan/chitin deacetylase (PgdA/CDA1 family)
VSRSILRRLAATSVVGGAAALVERLDDAGPRYLKVLTYHRVDRPEPFAQHVAHLARHHRVVSVDQVIAALRGGPPLPARSVLLTFDDGYRGFAGVAWPVLRARGLPAALFVPTAYPDSRRPAFWWDRLERGLGRTQRSCPLETPIGRLPLATSRERLRAGHRLKAWFKELAPGEVQREADALALAIGAETSTAHEVLGWDELRVLAAEGVAIGAHSRTHARLDRLAPEELREEVLGSLADLAREIPRAPRVFAYPYGCYDEHVVEVLRAAGAELAFTTRLGTNDLWRCDPLCLKRLNVGEADPLPVVRAKLAATAARLEPLTRWLVPAARGAARGAARAGRQEPSRDAPARG